LVIKFSINIIILNIIMNDNNLLMIILAFVFGYCLQSMMKDMCGRTLIEGAIGTCGYGHGKVTGSDGCTKCPKGTWNRKNDAFYNTMTVCTNCPTGKTTRGEGSSGAGGSECNVCQKGYWKDDTDCTACPTGKTTQAEDSSLVSDCNVCAIGYYKDDKDDTCKPCPAGKYKDTEGSAKCSPCPPGKYQDKTGQASCKTCTTSLVKYRRGNAFKIFTDIKGRTSKFGQRPAGPPEVAQTTIYRHTDPPPIIDAGERKDVEQGDIKMVGDGGVGSSSDGKYCVPCQNIYNKGYYYYTGSRGPESHGADEKDWGYTVPCKLNPDKTGYYETKS
jgi:hypothetical protein